MRESEEIWRPVVGYEGFYEVSDCGNVRSLDREINAKHNSKAIRKGVFLKLLDINGYLSVGLCKNGKRTWKRVHRLVAEAFIPNPNNLPQVNHINEFDKTDNRVENLEWCTQEYNNNYGTHNDRVAEKLRNNQISSKKVYQYTLDNQLVKVWESTMECGRNGFCQSHVASCCRGERNTHKGYIWRYE